MYVPGHVGPPFPRDHVVIGLSIWKTWTLEKGRSSLPEKKLKEGVGMARRRMKGGWGTESTMSYT